MLLKKWVPTLWNWHALMTTLADYCTNHVGAIGFSPDPHNKQKRLSVLLRDQDLHQVLQDLEALLIHLASPVKCQKIGIEKSDVDAPWSCWLVKLFWKKWNVIEQQGWG